jgi:hemerythrin-like domain-containing protein
MASALDFIREEHRNIARVLHTLEDLAEDDAVLARGVKSGLIASMLHYLRVFPYSIHHPNEEQELFPAVAAKDRNAAVIVAALLKDHAKSYALLREIDATIAGADTATGLTRLKAAIRTYVSHKQRHIKREEQEILPVAEQILDVETLAAMRRAFAASAGSKSSDEFRMEFESLYSHGKKKK